MTGICRAQETLKQLRRQHECPPTEDVATAVSKAQETAAALETCASMHDLGFAFYFTDMPVQAGTVAVDALAAALRAAHLHVLQGGTLSNAGLLHDLQGAWSALQCTFRILSDHTCDSPQGAHLQQPRVGGDSSCQLVDVIKGVMHADELPSPTDEAVSGYLEVLVPAVNKLPDVARAVISGVAASAAETQAARKEQEAQRLRLESAEADNSRLQEQLSGLLARCDQDLQQVREETQAAQALAHDQIAELLVRMHACMLQQFLCIPQQHPLYSVSFIKGVTWLSPCNRATRLQHGSCAGDDSGRP